ncbi:MAG: sigma-70 family RNA polymerase sigma factor, partial [Anaerolineae bacterium]
MRVESLRNRPPPTPVPDTDGGSAGSSPLEAERLLASRATRGDRAAYSALYERYVDKIYRYIYYKVGDREQSEDLTSQTFLKAWHAIADYEWRSYPFGAWLFRIAHNLVVDYHRARRETASLDDASPHLERRTATTDLRP